MNRRWMHSFQTFYSSTGEEILENPARRWQIGMDYKPWKTVGLFSQERAALLVCLDLFMRKSDDSPTPSSSDASLAESFSKYFVDKVDQIRRVIDGAPDSD